METKDDSYEPIVRRLLAPIPSQKETYFPILMKSCSCIIEDTCSNQCIKEIQIVLSSEMTFIPIYFSRKIDQFFSPFSREILLKQKLFPVWLWKGNRPFASLWGIFMYQFHNREMALILWVLLGDLVFFLDFKKLFQIKLYVEGKCLIEDIMFCVSICLSVYLFLSVCRTVIVCLSVYLYLCLCLAQILLL